MSHSVWFPTALLRRITAICATVLIGASACGQAPRNAAPNSEDPVVREALSACFAGDRLALQTAFRRAVAREQASGDARTLRTSEVINFLFNSTLKDREQFLLGQELALAEVRNNEFRSSILWSLLGDEYYELALLKGENRFNRFTRIFNRASSAVSRLVLLQPQAAAQLLLDSFYTSRKGRMPTDRERRMLYLGRTFLEKYPNAAEAEEVRQMLALLHQKMEKERAVRDNLVGKAMIEAGHPQTAEFHLERAVLLTPTDPDAQKALADARQAQSQAEVLASRAVSVSGMESRLGVGDLATLEAACRALLRRDGKALAAAANSNPVLRDSVTYALACLSERNGHHTDALGRLDELSRATAGTPGGRAAKASLENPSYHLERAFDVALADHGQRQREYVLSGNRTKEDTAFAVGDAALRVAPAQAAVGLPALFFTDIMVRGVAERFRSTLATDEAVDAGARLIRRHPSSPRAREIASAVATLSRRGRDLDRTEEYLDLAGGRTAKEDAKLREGRARALLDQSKSSGDYLQKKKLLMEIVEKYGGTKVEATARKELAKLPPTLGPGAVVLTSKMLSADLRLASALGIAEVLVDGKTSNGELAEEGLAIEGNGERLAFRLRDGETFYTVDFPAEHRDWLLTAARQLRAGYERSAAGKLKEQNRYLPAGISGGAGSGGVEVSPHLQPYADDPERMKLFKR